MIFQARSVNPAFAGRDKKVTQTHPRDERSADMARHLAFKRRVPPVEIRARVVPSAGGGR